MRILGIDPGTATTGFGCIEITGPKTEFIGAGVISTAAGLEMGERLATIYTELNELIREFKPDKVAVELLFFARNVTTAITVGQARGIIILSAAQHNLPVDEFTPLQVKQAVTGYGKADKRQVQEMVKTLLALKQIPKPDDAADALAIALCSAQSI
ncbi:MAG TPA: crossover junction endodeoxyribonuclease RuvC [Candidatus Nanoarchaeia archaeon]|nr:crossover junction endodeoxyribonuclease RuvC [Candidatus Nanoarchaeia archaeon]